LVTKRGFLPDNFTVKAGQVVILVVKGVDATHVFKFSDPSLKGIAIGVAKGESRGIVFNAQTNQEIILSTAMFLVIKPEEKEV